MKVDISQIRNKKNMEELPVSFLINGEDINCEPRVVNFSAPIQIEGTVTAEKYGFLFSGSIEAKADILCDRCLTPVAVPIYMKFETLFIEKETSGYQEAEKEAEETETFSGEILDLEGAIRRNILLSLPMKVLCKEDCKGLCPHCGKDLNEGACGCKEVYRNPKFEGLRSLFESDQ